MKRLFSGFFGFSGHKRVRPIEDDWLDAQIFDAVRQAQTQRTSQGPDVTQLRARDALAKADRAFDKP